MNIDEFKQRYAAQLGGLPESRLKNVYKKIQRDPAASAAAIMEAISAGQKSYEAEKLKQRRQPAVVPSQVKEDIASTSAARDVAAALTTSATTDQSRCQPAPQQVAMPQPVPQVVPQLVSQQVAMPQLAPQQAMTPPPKQEVTTPSPSPASASLSQQVAMPQPVPQQVAMPQQVAAPSPTLAANNKPIDLQAVRAAMTAESHMIPRREPMTAPINPPSCVQVPTLAPINPLQAAPSGRPDSKGLEGSGVSAPDGPEDTLEKLARKLRNGGAKPISPPTQADLARVWRPGLDAKCRQCNINPDLLKQILHIKHAEIAASVKTSPTDIRTNIAIEARTSKLYATLDDLFMLHAHNPARHSVLDTLNALRF